MIKKLSKPIGSFFYNNPSPSFSETLPLRDTPLDSPRFSEPFEIFQKITTH